MTGGSTTPATTWPPPPPPRPAPPQGLGAWPPPAWPPPAWQRPTDAPAAPAAATWWSTRRGWLLVTLVALAGLLLVVEHVAIATAFVAHPLVGETVLWVGAPLLSLVLGSVLYRAVTGRSVWGQRRWRGTDLAWGAGFGVLVLLADAVLGAVFVAVVSDPGAPVQGWIDAAMIASPVLVGLGVSVATPLGEEVLARGLLLRGVEARFPRWVAVAVSSLLFGLLHLENLDPAGWFHVASAAVAGTLFALALLKAGHLLAAVTAHVVVNGAYTLLGLLVTGGVLTVGPTGDIPSIDLEVGACARAAWWNGEAIDAASEVDCTKAHDVEVGSRAVLDGPVYDVPVDTAWLADLAHSSCVGDFETYVGHAWETSPLDVVPVLSDPDRWAAGDRELICLVVPYEAAELTEHARGSGR